MQSGMGLTASEWEMSNLFHKNVKYEKMEKLILLVTYFTINYGGHGHTCWAHRAGIVYVRDSSFHSHKTLPKLTIFQKQPFTHTFTLSTHLKAINMKLHILLLITLVASAFLSVEGSLRGLKKGNTNLFDDDEKSKRRGSSSKPEEEPTNTTGKPEEETIETTPGTEEPITSVFTDATAVADNVADDEYIEVDVAITYNDSVSPEEQRKVDIILMETLNELGIGPLTDGAAPPDAVMALDSFSSEESEEALRRRLSGRYSRYIGPCRRCLKKRRRGLKKSPSIKKTLEDKLNKALKKQGIKLKVKVDDVQYFSFEKPSA